MSPIPGDRSACRFDSPLAGVQQPFWLRVNGRSMEPGIRSRDLVRISPTDSEALSSLPLGSLVLFYDPESRGHILHRLVGRGKHVLFQRGDATGVVKGIRPSAVIGAATHLKRNGRIRTLPPSLPWQLRHLLNRVMFR